MFEGAVERRLCAIFRRPTAHFYSQERSSVEVHAFVSALKRQKETPLPITENERASRCISSDRKFHRTRF